MRVSNRSTYQGIQLQLFDIAGQLKSLNEQISSGKRINRPSDDPIGITQSMGLNNILSKIDQYQKNIEFGAILAQRHGVFAPRHQQFDRQGKRDCESDGDRNATALISEPMQPMKFRPSWIS